MFKYPKISFEKYIQQLNPRNEIGKGTQGTVYKLHIQNQIQLKDGYYAAQIVNYRDQQELLGIKEEIKILEKVRLVDGALKMLAFGFLEQQKDSNSGISILISQLYDCSLADAIKKKDQFQKDSLNFFEKLLIFQQLMKTFLNLLDPRDPICHSDLKPSNILIQNRTTIAVCDFGAGMLFREGDELKSKLSNAQAFTVFYSAPQILNMNPRLNSDVYSIGKTMLSLLFEREEVIQEIDMISFIQQVDFNKQLIDLLLRMTAEDSQHRLTINKAFNQLQDLCQTIQFPPLNSISSLITSNKIESSSYDFLNKNEIKRSNIILLGSNLSPFSIGGSDDWYFKQLIKIFGELIIPINPDNFNDYRKVKYDEYNDCQLIVIPADQQSSDYQKIYNNYNQLIEFTQKGHGIIFSFCGWGWQGGQPPLNLPGLVDVQVKQSFQYNCFLYDESFQQYCSDIPNPLVASVASHASFIGPIGKNILVFTQDEDGQATTIAYKIGQGFIIATGLSIESPNNTSQGDKYQWRKFFEKFYSFFSDFSFFKD